jgi:hypothetical protein
MPVSLISLPELKTYLGITGTSDDSLLASCASNASAIAQADTSRVFAVSSNVTRRYSTDGQTAITVHDRPYNDATRVVSWLGVTLVQDVNYWLLEDRRNPDVGTVIQLRPFDMGQSAWYKADPLWWDKNLDRRRWVGGVPNDLVVTGTEGHPVLPDDVRQAVTELAGWLYYRAKGGTSGFATSPFGEQVDLAEYPPTYQRFVAHWRLRTGVGVVGG